MSNVRFRLIGINQDDRADGTGKAGLTFQTIGYYTNNNILTSGITNTAGGWRDSMLRKNLNDKSTGTIWNAIQSTDFNNNIAPVLKITNNSAYDYYMLGSNYKNSDNTSNASNITVDKLYILSPSEMGMPIMNGYNVANGNQNNANEYNANVHYYDSDSYKNTIKSSKDCNFYGWYSNNDYIYFGNTYQWWMLPAGSRKMSNDNQAYHNTDSKTYIASGLNKNPSTIIGCYAIHYWLRATYHDSYYSSGDVSIFDSGSLSYLPIDGQYNNSDLIVSFSF